MQEINERLAVAEARIETLEGTNVKVLEKLEAIERQMTRYHGFLGGVAFLITGIGIAWNMFGEWIRAHWQ